MAVMIRLARYGRKKKPYYRVVVTDKENPRDGRFIEHIGRYNPLIDPPMIELNEERVKHWISVGAKPSDTLAHFIEGQFPGFLSTIEAGRKERIRSRRNKRKQKAGGKTANPRSESKTKRVTRAKREKPAPKVKAEAAAEA